VSFTLTVEGVSTTALADVLLTGCVLEVRADPHVGNKHTVTVRANNRETLDVLAWALQRPHEPRRMIRLREIGKPS
jgi:hypothetical protein